MGLSDNFRDRDKQSWRENPTDQGTDRRVADLDAHDKLDTIATALGANEGQAVNIYNQLSSVASGSWITAIAYVVPTGKKAYLQLANGSGTNIAEYRIAIDGNIKDMKRTWFAGGLNVDFVFGDVTKISGLEVLASQTVTVEIRHNRTVVGDFNARIQLRQIDA